MEYKTLRKSDLTISRIGFGCMSLKDNQAENEKIIHKALEHGINYFDTADIYDKGRNEMSVGKALKGKREQAIIATKVGNQWRSDGSGLDWSPGKQYILAAVEESLNGSEQIILTCTNCMEVRLKILLMKLLKLLNF